MQYVERLDKRFQTSKAESVSKWFKTRWTVKRDAKEATEQRNAATLKSLLDKGVNFYLLKARSNPATEGLLADIFSEMLCSEVFKPRDIVEAIRDNHPTCTKAKLETYISQLCKALAAKEIIKTEGKGLYCLYTR